LIKHNKTKKGRPKMAFNKEHNYRTTLVWTGNRGNGTVNYSGYDRNFTISIKDKADIEGSSDPAFLGDKNRHNPEELFVASLSSCHMLWYLHLCAEAGIVIVDYTDEAQGIMQETVMGGGRFIEVILHPVVTITDATSLEQANELHNAANKNCFIANSCNFPVRHKAQCVISEARKVEEK
jgi:organic hydroperoxide reductase OsmC/OhrA